MNIVRKPDSQRGPQLARSAKAIDAGMRMRPRRPGAGGGVGVVAADPLRKPSGSSPWLESTRAGSRIAQHRAEHEDQEGQAQRPSRVRPDQGRQAGQRGRHDRADDAGHRRPGVRLHQGEALGEDPGHGRGPGDVVGLGGHQAAERGGEEHRRLVDDRAGEHPRQEGADRHGGADGPAAAVAEAVQERADQGRDDREREHRQAEEQRDLTAGLVGRHLEEQRAGQRDRQGGVARRVERAQLDQPGQPAALGALGARGPVGRADGVAPARGRCPGRTSATRDRWRARRSPRSSGGACRAGLLLGEAHAVHPARARVTGEAPESGPRSERQRRSSRASAAASCSRGGATSAA